MVGWNLFERSLTQIYLNFGNAIKASLLLWILFYLSLTIVRGIFENISFLANIEHARGTLVKYESWSRYLFLAVNYTIKISIVSLIAIIWHRFILLGKHSLRLIPVLEFRIWFTYMKAIIPVLIITSTLMFSIGIVGELLLENVNLSYDMNLVIIFTMTSILCFVNLRIGLVLPASAVGKPIKILDSWRMTGKLRTPILIFSILLAGVFVLLNYGMLYFGFRLSVLVMMSLFTGWITLMVGISALTTLYGYLMENRQLD